MRSDEREDVQIIGYDERYARDFARLNYDWIEKYYGVEEHDREILDHPFSYVIQPGGQIFFALAADKVAGTVALIKLMDSKFELAKMAVSRDHQGQGIGKRLMDACIDHGRRQKAPAIVLESNTKQKVAIELYRKYGFVETPLDPNSFYDRANIRMELALDRPNM